jgi:hypothetical protein
VKFRDGFVSNSSSSSFVISRNLLTDKQVEQIMDHMRVAHRLQIGSATEFASEHDAWHIDVTDESVSGRTWMDNFDMRAFLKGIGVPNNVVNSCIKKDG